MFNTVNGIPGHVLLVHAVVILVPLAGALAILATVWPAARRRLGIITPLAALLALLFVPLASGAGEWLQEHVPETPLVAKHAEMGGGLTAWAALLFLLSALAWLLPELTARGRALPSILTARWVQPALGSAVCLIAVVAVIQTVRIGDSGAKAAWDGKVSSSVIGGGG
ncbi:MAG: hypothetical protein ABI140_14740 [Jatrophihabitantaceae bacterium]